MSSEGAGECGRLAHLSSLGPLASDHDEDSHGEEELFTTESQVVASCT